jgi:hypothetical protein
MSANRGYPLGALFVLVTACAVLIAGITPIVQDIGQPDGHQVLEVLTALGIGAGCGLLVGVVVGLLQFRMAVGAAMGALAGIVIGAASGIIVLLTSDQITTAAAAMTAGSALVVGVALIMRRPDV